MQRRNGKKRRKEKGSTLLAVVRIIGVRDRSNELRKCLRERKQIRKPAGSSTMRRQVLMDSVARRVGKTRGIKKDTHRNVTIKSSCIVK